MITLTEEGRKEIFRIIPDDTFDLQSYFDYLPPREFEDLLKISNRQPSDVSLIEMEHLSKIAIALVFIELDIDNFAKDSLEEFIGNLTFNVLTESLKRKGMIQIDNRLSIIIHSNATVTERGEKAIKYNQG